MSPVAQELNDIATSFTTNSQNSYLVLVLISLCLALFRLQVALLKIPYQSRIQAFGLQWFFGRGRRYKPFMARHITSGYRDVKIGTFRQVYHFTSYDQVGEMFKQQSTNDFPSF